MPAQRVTVRVACLSCNKHHIIPYSHSSQANISVNYYTSLFGLRTTSVCGIFSLRWRPVGSLQLLSALWLGCCHIDIFSFSIFNFIFSSPGPKGQVSLCHHLASIVVRRLSSSVVCRRKLFQESSPLKLLGQILPNFNWMFLRVSSL